MSLMTPETIRVNSIRNKFGNTPFFNTGRVDTLRKMILPYLDADNRLTSEFPDARVVWEWNNRVMARSSNFTPLGPVNPFYLNEHYEGGDPNSVIVSDEFTAACDLATRYLILNDVPAGDASLRIISAWSRVTKVESNAASGLNWADQFPVLLQAAMMMRTHPGYTQEIADRLVVACNAGIEPVRIVGGVATNNFGGWANCYEIAISGFLGNREMFDNAIVRWRTVFDGAVVNNVPVHEIYRQSSGQGDGSYGLWYSNFFLYSMVAAAEWARFYGEWLYDYTSNTDGSTFKGLAMNIRQWTRYPETFPYNTSGTPSDTPRILMHDDVLHALWPDERSQWLIDNFPTGSIRDIYGMRGAVLAYRYRPLYG